MVWCCLMFWLEERNFMKEHSKKERKYQQAQSEKSWKQTSEAFEMRSLDCWWWFFFLLSLHRLNNKSVLIGMDKFDWIIHSSKLINFDFVHCLKVKFRCLLVLSIVSHGFTGKNKKKKKKLRRDIDINKVSFCSDGRQMIEKKGIMRSKKSNFIVLRCWMNGRQNVWRHRK